jgi:photosystem II stability/assembly factor-like uncharacterized protein
VLVDISPLDATGNTVFAGTGSASSLSNAGGLPIGIMKTTDDGATWSVFQLDPTGAEPQVRVVVPTTYDANDNPAVTQVVLVGTVGNGLYRSIDAGETYTQISGSGVGLLSGSVTDIVVDPNDDDIYYAGVVGRGVYRSDDGGATWTDVNNANLSTNAALSSSTAVMLTAHAGGGTTRVYAMISYDDADTTMYELTNADTATGPGPGLAPAAQWTAVPVGAGFNAVNDNDDACLVAGGRSGGADNEEVLIACSDDNIFIRSTAGGTLTVTPTAFPGGNVQAIATDPEDWQHIFVADSGQVWETLDAGNTWTEITGNLPTINSRLQSLAYVSTLD